MRLLRRFLADESGATAIEYGIVLSVIVLFLIGAMTLFGTKLATTFNTLSNTVK